MALPLKSGADLYNQQLIRAAVWNYSADGLDPSEYATGLMYFNTNPSSNMYQKLRFRTATDWKTIAFAEDLDVATNKDFQALKEKVELLSGEVDTDAIISNMKEVTAFLEGFAEDANLMEALNKKYDKEGGVIKGRTTTPIIIDTVEDVSEVNILFRLNGSGKGYVGWNQSSGTYIYNNNGKRYIGIQDDGTPYYGTSSAKNTLLHSGNVGDYEAGRAKILSDYAGRIQSANLNSFADNGVRKFIASTSMKEGKPPYDGSILHFAWDNNMGFDQQLFLANSSQVKVNERMAWRAQHDGVWGDWKTIAFTDSTVEAAKRLETPRAIWGQSFDGTGNVNGHLYLPNNKAIYSYDTSGVDRQLLIFTNDLYIGWGVSEASRNTILLGNNLYFRYGTTPTTGLILNSSGNVTIGYADFARSKWKTFITGNTFVYSLVDANARPTLGNIPEGVFSIGYHSNGDVLYGLHMWSENSGNGVIQASRADGTAKIFSILLNPLGGKVGIGLTSPSAQLHVNEDIVANGTIACKGVAEVGDIAGMGTVDKWIGMVDKTTNSQVYTHGLNTEDITVSIYEKNGSEWVLVLTDVDIVDQNRIRVMFGTTPTIDHKIVVMG